MSGVSKKCECGHVTSDHAHKRLTKDSVTVKQWHSECQWYDCECTMFNPC